MKEDRLVGGAHPHRRASPARRHPRGGGTHRRPPKVALAAASRSSAPTPFGFAGGYTDPTGLVYLLHRYYDPSTGQFLSVDPLVGLTQAPYSYAGNDPVNGSDPSGLCVKVLWMCIGGGPQTSSIGFRFDPGAGANAVVNIGRGASFGLSDKIANWISPGASCTVPQNGVDQFIGGAATAVTGGELLGGLFPGGEAVSVDGLLSSGAELDPADAGGQLTRAGRAYAKAGEVFGPTSGGPAAIYEAGQSALQEILTDPATTYVHPEPNELRFANRTPMVPIRVIVATAVVAA